MKASLYSRSNVRLKFLNQESVSYKVLRKFSLKYNTHSAQQDAGNHSATYEYIFTGVNEAIPQSDIIVFANDLPVTYAKTTGSKGNKFSTKSAVDLDIEVKDMLVSLEKGKEKITRHPPEFPDSRIKEIETREQDFEIKRKITFKNTSTEKVESFEFVFTETKDIRFKSSTPKPGEKDLPEYKWIFDIEPEKSVNIEIELSAKIIKTFEIEKPNSGKQEDEFPHFQQSVEQAYFQENENQSMG